MSLSAKFAAALIRAVTYSRRKRHLSMSETVRLKEYSRAPRGVTVTETLFGQTRAKIFRPKNNDRSSAPLLFIHGGGASQGLGKMYAKFAARLAKVCKTEVVAADYIPDAGRRFPSLHDEIFAFYSSFAADTRFFYAAGDSFGANLLLSSMLAAREQGIPLPLKAAVISPYLDLSASGDSYLKNAYLDPVYSLTRRERIEDGERFIRRKSAYCGDTDPTDPGLSPVFNDFRKFPPMLIQVGEYETSLSDSEMLAEKLKAAECKHILDVYPEMWHDFQILTPFLPESRAALRQLGEFFSDKLP